MSSKNSKDLMREYTLLGQTIAGIDPLLSSTSCMNPELRETIAYIFAYQSLLNTSDFEDMKQTLMVIARITWPRKELTDLALRVGENVTVGDFEEDVESTEPATE